MPRALIVDDAANLRLLYRIELEAEGYEIITAAGSIGAKKLWPSRSAGVTGKKPFDIWPVYRKLQLL